jgi:oligopeptide/dipeptide ABC transporter ATP-binding protein
VDDVSFFVSSGETVALVGESGCGKSLTALAAMRLNDRSSIRESGTIEFEGKDITQLAAKELHEYRGFDVAIIFQEPMTALNPVIRCGAQIKEVLDQHDIGSGEKSEVIDLLKRVKMPNPAETYKSYPHELSGGMRQRILIAMALAGSPKLLIADEPTTALDVTVQGQIIELLSDLQHESGMGILFITHDLTIVESIADRLLIMYAGQILEEGRAGDVLNNPKHPYTQALLSCAPSIAEKKDKLSTIPGSVPQPGAYPIGCRFHPRCDLVESVCSQDEPILQNIEGRVVRCPVVV